jgi:hypothetical protein
MSQQVALAALCCASMAEDNGGGSTYLQITLATYISRGKAMGGTNLREVVRLTSPRAFIPRRTSVLCTYLVNEELAAGLPTNARRG